MSKYDIERMPIIYQAEIEQETYTVLQKAKEIGPLRILGEDGREMILMSWTDFLEKFGCLYTAEEIAKIEEACRKYGEHE